MISKTHLIFFSPTVTTKKTVEQIAAGIGATECHLYDLTRMETGLDLELSDGLALVGIPVYAGRVPEICLERMTRLSATGIPVVLVALYGNREFEDALVELRDVAVAKGFQVVAAGAFIGEHSYSTDGRPIAANRPDTADLQLAAEFGEAIARRLQTGEESPTPIIPGNTPYRERVQLGGVAPETDPELCTLCGRCAAVCPTFVIKVEKMVLTEAAHCLMCCACVKICPEQARQMKHPAVEAKREMLVRNCAERKEPVWFL